jgi:acetylserotonin N-methyltransferase
MLSNPAPVLDLMDAFRRSKAMFVSVSLGLFDRLQRGPASAAQISAEGEFNLNAVERLMDACVGLELLDKVDGIYSNLPVANTYLCSDSPHTLAGYIRYSEFALYPLWGNLSSAIREGSHRWKQTFGGEGALFSNFFKTEESKRDFLAGMNGFGMLSSPSVVEAFDLSRYRRLVDLGGATGHLPIAACERYPKLRGIVFDLPEVVPVTREHLEKSTAADRLSAVAGDFFTDKFPDADLYSLGRILHDWAEDKINTLLEKIYNSLPSGGALLVAERLLYDDKSGPVPAQMQSLNMLVCTEGRERTLPEYTALLKKAGFATVEGKVTGKPVDAVLAVKG